MMVFAPRWSPDGNRIAFEARLPGKPWKIYTISAEGGVPRQVTTDDQNDGDVQWSPDGKSLLYGGKPFMEDMQGMKSEKTAIYLVDLQTLERSMLPGSQGSWSPSWSPDGRYIAASRFERHLSC